jgi:signal transduction histidine kinase
VRTPEKYKETIRSILADAEEMTDTVRGLLQLARVDRIQELTREKIDLSAAVERHIARLCDRAQREGIELAVNADPGVTILADEGRIGEVVTNLVDNAVKYTPHGGHVDVSVRSLDGRAQLVVSDSGVGFNSEQAEHLFDRFYRADVPEVQARSGSGLGLAIVKAIVSVYGGRVAASSEGKGRGSTFLVELPAVGE